MFFTFCAFFPSFISNTSIVSINFGANLDAQNAGNGISVLQISKIFGVSTPPDGGFMHVILVCWPHTWPSAIAIPLYIISQKGEINILSHRKVPFQKMPPPPPPQRENP